MITMLYKSYTFRSLLSLSIAFIYFTFIAKHRLIHLHTQVITESTDQVNYEHIIPRSSRRLSSNDVESPFMSEFCYDFIDDPEISLLVKHISAIMIIHNEMKNGVIKSVSFIYFKNKLPLYDILSKDIQTY